MKDNIVDIRDRVAHHDLRYDAVPWSAAKTRSDLRRPATLGLNGVKHG